MIVQGSIGGDVKRPYGGTDATLFFVCQSPQSASARANIHAVGEGGRRPASTVDTMHLN